MDLLNCSWICLVWNNGVIDGCLFHLQKIDSLQKECNTKDSLSASLKSDLEEKRKQIAALQESSTVLQTEKGNLQVNPKFFK